MREGNRANLQRLESGIEAGRDLVVFRNRLDRNRMILWLLAEAMCDRPVVFQNRQDEVAGGKFLRN